MVNVREKMTGIGWNTLDVSHSRYGQSTGHVNQLWALKRDSSHQARPWSRIKLRPETDERIVGPQDVGPMVHLSDDWVIGIIGCQTNDTTQPAKPDLVYDPKINESTTYFLTANFLLCSQAAKSSLWCLLFFRSSCQQLKDQSRIYALSSCSDTLSLIPVWDYQTRNH